MNIDSITTISRPFPSIASDLRADRPAASERKGSSSFGAIIGKAIESLNTQQLGAEAEIARAVAGESRDLHRTIAALQAADLSFQLALQVRNKLIGAYEEIMRMQV